MAAADTGDTAVSCAGGNRGAQMKSRIERIDQRLAVVMMLVAAFSTGGQLLGAYPDQAEVTVLQGRFDAIASEMGEIVRAQRLRGGPKADEITLSRLRDSALLAAERSAHLADLAAVAAETNARNIREFCEEQMRSNAMGQLYSEFAIPADVSQAHRAAKRDSGERAGKLALELIDALEQYMELLMGIVPKRLAAPPEEVPL
jgi:hypothetical protein